MPHWLEVTLALSLALIGAWIIAAFAARLVESGLHGILQDERERRLVDRPKTIVRVVIFLIAAVTLSIPAVRLAGYRLSTREAPEETLRELIKGGLRIAAIGIVAYAVIRMGSAAVRRFEREMSAGTGLAALERGKRAQTLGGLLQNALSIVVTSIAALMILRVLDVDVTPVLTGAGIVGLAVGFGAQTLVRDFISGFFLIVEDQIRVGDAAVVNGQSGMVEAVNLRTIVLRDEEGTVHVVPNGEIKTLSNRSKDFCYYVISVSLPYDDDPERVSRAMMDAAASIMADPTFRPHILEPLEVYGVDDFQPGHIVIKGRIKTVPLKQAVVGRELRKRLAATLKERGLEPPVPSVNVRVEGLESLLAARDPKPEA
jgi:moderate conductance mechanosensitive channel